MARVTVEDCIVEVPNRFDLVMLAAQRAREIGAGAPLTLDRDDDKNPVVALREIADKTVELENLNDSIVQGLQKHVEMDEAEEEAVEFDLSDMAIGAEGTGLVTEALAVEEAESEDGAAEGQSAELGAESGEDTPAEPAEDAGGDDAGGDGAGGDGAGGDGAEDEPA